MLADQIGEYLPGNFNALESSDFPAVLASGVHRVTDLANRFRHDVKFVPVLSTAYADKQRMLTVACAVRPADEEKLPDSLGKWKISSKEMGRRDKN